MRTVTEYAICAGTRHIVRAVMGMERRAVEMRYLRTAAAQRGARDRITADTIWNVMAPITTVAETAAADIIVQGITAADIIDNRNRKERRQPQGCSRFFGLGFGGKSVHKGW